MESPRTTTVAARPSTSARGTTRGARPARPTSTRPASAGASAARSGKVKTKTTKTAAAKASEAKILLKFSIVEARPKAVAQAITLAAVLSELYPTDASSGKGELPASMSAWTAMLLDPVVEHETALAVSEGHLQSKRTQEANMKFGIELRQKRRQNKMKKIKKNREKDGEEDEDEDDEDDDDEEEEEEEVVDDADADEDDDDSAHPNYFFVPEPRRRDGDTDKKKTILEPRSDPKVRRLAVEYMLKQAGLPPSARLQRVCEQAQPRELRLDCSNEMTEAYSRVVVDSVVRRNERLRVLSMRHNGLPAAAVENVLWHLPAGVTELDLSGNCSSADAWAHLRRPQNLQRLSLAEMAMKPTDCLNLVSQIMKQHDNNGLLSQGEDDEEEEADSTESHSRRRTKKEKSAALTVQPRSRRSSSLLLLDLRGNAIGAVGCAAVGSYLLGPEAGTLRHLLLGANKLDSAAVELVVYPLVALHREEKDEEDKAQKKLALRTLDLADNRLGAGVPAAALQTALAGLLTRERKQNDDKNAHASSKSAVEWLADVLESNESLTHLSLAGNNLSKAAIELLAQSLELNGSLTGFHVEGNGGARLDAKGFLKWDDDDDDDEQEEEDHDDDDDDDKEALGEGEEGEEEEQPVAPAGENASKEKKKKKKKLSRAQLEKAAKRRAKTLLSLNSTGSCSSCWVCASRTNVRRRLVIRCPEVVETVNLHFESDGWTPTPCEEEAGRVVCECVLPGSTRFFASASLVVRGGPDGALHRTAARAVELRRTSDGWEIVLGPFGVGNSCFGLEEHGFLLSEDEEEEAEAAREAYGLEEGCVATWATTLDALTRVENHMLGDQMWTMARLPLKVVTATPTKAGASLLPEEEEEAAAVRVTKMDLFMHEKHGVALPTERAALALAARLEEKAARARREAEALIAIICEEDDFDTDGLRIKSDAQLAAGVAMRARLVNLGLCVTSAGTPAAAAASSLSCSWAQVSRHCVPGRMLMVVGEEEEEEEQVPAALNVVESCPDWVLKPRLPSKKKDEARKSMAWDLVQDSIFVPRLREEGTLFDSDRRLKRAFQCDWSLVADRVLKLRAFKREFQEDGEDDDLPNPLSACGRRAEAALQKGYRRLRASFRHYAIIKREQAAADMTVQPHKLHAAGFKRLWVDSGLCSKGVLQPPGLDRVFFLTTNVEGGDMERHQLLEAVVRVAIAVFHEPGVCGTVGESIDCALEALTAVEEPDDLRRVSLYTQQVDASLRPAQTELRRSFEMLCQGKKRLESSSWLDLFFFFFFDEQEAEAQGKTTTSSSPEEEGADTAEACSLARKQDLQLVFASCKFTLSDEVGGFQRLDSLGYHDFVESVWRVALLNDPGNPASALALLVAKLKLVKQPRKQQTKQQQKTVAVAAAVSTASTVKERSWLALGTAPRVVGRMRQIAATSPIKARPPRRRSRDPGGLVVVQRPTTPAESGLSPRDFPLFEAPPGY